MRKIFRTFLLRINPFFRTLNRFSLRRFKIEYFVLCVTQDGLY
jgi:hypothetical protein